jgi:hypothetical protein
MAAPLVWNFRVTGASEASRQLQEISAATRGASTDSKEYSRELRSQAREANAVVKQDEYRARIMMTNHPVLLNTVKAAGFLSSALRSVVAVQNMWNTAMLLSRGASEDQIVNADELAIEQTKLNDLRARGKEGTVQYQIQLEKVNELHDKGRQLAKENSSAQLNSAINFVTGGVLIGSTIAQMIPKLLAFAGVSVGTSATFTGALTSMNVAQQTFSKASLVAFATNPWFLLAAAVAIVTVLIVTHWDDVVKFYNTYLIPAFNTVGKVFSDVGQWMAANWKTLFSVLTLGTGALVIYLIDHWQEISSTLAGVWDTMRKGFAAFWNGFASIANQAIGGITAGIQGFVNAAVDAINVLISAYNAAARLVGAGGISYISHISLTPPKIPMIAAAAGFEGVVSSPTMFLAGEAGQPEHVSIGAAGGSRGGSGRSPIIINISVNGSVITERELEHNILRGLETRLRDKGFGGG